MIIDSLKGQQFVFLGGLGVWPGMLTLNRLKIGETAAIKGFGAAVRAIVVSFVNKLKG